MAVLYLRNKHGKVVELPVIVGRSAYQTAVKNGFEGTEAEWLETLVGLSAYQTAVKNGFKGTESEWLKSLKGDPGYTPQKDVDYKDGLTPVKGEDYWTPDEQEEIVNYANAKGGKVESVSADKTVTVDDMGKFLSVEAAATITVPADAFQVGIEIEVFRNTSEAVTIVAADGVSFAIPGNTELVTESQTISYQYASIILKQIADNVWSIQGAI